MGIYLKNINKPNNCISCPLHHMIGRYHYCQAFKPYLYMKEFKKSDIKDDCPIIEIPPHGRIIDAGTLMREMHNTILEDGEDRRIFYSVIERQPTIIETDESDMDSFIRIFKD